eukprot:TRINITY_DN4225_c0_g1_i6.p1 TRINITY_DN4225_c0_g1~~TRINITY_DN4225_c0_g1_i6.p1  ORF type:complete len:222 (+),score=37.82 TRINITY_DN4225_c0_g1_i6:54-719(+)
MQASMTHTSVPSTAAPPTAAPPGGSPLDDATRFYMLGIIMTVVVVTVVTVVVYSYHTRVLAAEEEDAQAHVIIRIIRDGRHGMRPPREQNTPDPEHTATARSILNQYPRVLPADAPSRYTCCVCLESASKAPVPQSTAPYGDGEQGDGEQGAASATQDCSWVVLPCGHEVHLACVEEWLVNCLMVSRPTACPVCRAKLRIDAMEAPAGGTGRDEALTQTDI